MPSAYNTVNPGTYYNTVNPHAYASLGPAMPQAHTPSMTASQSSVSPSATSSAPPQALSQTVPQMQPQAAAQMHSQMQPQMQPQQPQTQSQMQPQMPMQTQAQAAPQMQTGRQPQTQPLMQPSQHQLQQHMAGFGMHPVPAPPPPPLPSAYTTVTNASAAPPSEPPPPSPTPQSQQDPTRGLSNESIPQVTPQLQAATSASTVGEQASRTSSQGQLVAPEPGVQQQQPQQLSPQVSLDAAPMQYSQQMQQTPFMSAQQPGFSQAMYGSVSGQPAMQPNQSFLYSSNSQPLQASYPSMHVPVVNAAGQYPSMSGQPTLTPSQPMFNSMGGDNTSQAVAYQNAMANAAAAYHAAATAYQSVQGQAPLQLGDKSASQPDPSAMSSNVPQQ